jgi:hypothetical protein
MRLVSVVTSTRSPLLGASADLVQQVVDLALHRAHLDLGIDSPVGRMICSTTTPADLVSSYGPGVALT